MRSVPVYECVQEGKMIRETQMMRRWAIPLSLSLLLPAPTVAYASSQQISSIDGSWVELVPGTPKPSGRSGATAIYDPVRDRMVVFGGAYNDGSDHFLTEVWSLSLTGTPSWTLLIPTGTPPAGRTEHSAIYDPVRDRMVIFGGWMVPARAMMLGRSRWPGLRPGPR